VERQIQHVTTAWPKIQRSIGATGEVGACATILTIAHSQPNIIPEQLYAQERNLNNASIAALVSKAALSMVSADHQVLPESGFAKMPKVFGVATLIHHLARSHLPTHAITVCTAEPLLLGMARPSAIAILGSIVR